MANSKPVTCVVNGVGRTDEADSISVIVAYTIRFDDQSQQSETIGLVVSNIGNANQMLTAIRTALSAYVSALYGETWDETDVRMV